MSKDQHESLLGGSTRKFVVDDATLPEPLQALVDNQQDVVAAYAKEADREIFAGEVDDDDNPDFDSSISTLFNISQRFPQLSAEQEVTLAMAIEAGKQAQQTLAADDRGNLSAADLAELKALVAEGQTARDYFIYANVKLAFWASRKMLTWQWFSFEDKVSVALEAIIRTVDAFDYRQGWRFATPALTAIKRKFAELTEQTLRQSGMRGQATAMRGILLASVIIGARGDEITDEAIAQELPLLSRTPNLTPDEVRQVINLYDEVRATESLDALTDARTEDRPVEAPRLRIESPQDYDQVISTLAAEQVLSCVPDRYAQFVWLHYGFDGGGPRSHAEVAKELGEPLTTVSSGIRRVLKKLRNNPEIRELL